MTTPLLKIRPFQPADARHFCRLFKPLAREETFDVETMAKLGKSMSRVKPMTSVGANTPPVAYTYFGQFIDHDLTRDDTLFADAGLREPKKTRNYGGGRLDLSHIYGGGPGSECDGKLYDKDGASFRLGEVRSTITDQQFDLPLDDDGLPISADDRTPENLILRQLCVMFMRLHNIAVLESTGTPTQRYQAARQKVVWQYQWLVRRSFMRRVLDEEVYADVIKHANGGLIEWGDSGFSVPVEFSQAAFRFGHSMVRERYDLNDQPVFPLEALFRGPERKTALSKEQAIDWSKMTTEGGQSSRSIDPFVVTPLFKLPDDQFHHRRGKPNCPVPHQLPVRTLRRGAATRLPTGEQVATALKHESFSQKPSSPTALFALKRLAKYGLKGKTPLWYYILLEAEVEKGGNRLGTIGSRLVGEVIEGSLRTDPNSYVVQCGSDWNPPDWTSPFWSGAIENILGAAAVGGLYRI
jgi:hypothetical protein